MAQWCWSAMSTTGCDGCKHYKRIHLKAGTKARLRLYTGNESKMQLNLLRVNCVSYVMIHHQLSWLPSRLFSLRGHTSVWCTFSIGLVYVSSVSSAWTCDVTFQSSWTTFHLHFVTNWDTQAKHNLHVNIHRWRRRTKVQLLNMTSDNETLYVTAPLSNEIILSIGITPMVLWNQPVFRGPVDLSLWNWNFPGQTIGGAL